MKTKEELRRENIRYEDNANEITATGWACKTCGRWYGNEDRAEHMARWCCCTDMPCECGGRTEKGYTKCKTCRDKIDMECYYGKPEKPWDGITPLTCHKDDRWFWNLNDLLDYLETDAPTPKEIEELRLVICVPNNPGHFDLCDWLCDFLPEDDDPPGDWKAVEKAVNDYIDSMKPFSWTAGKYRPSIASILEMSKTKES